VCERCRREHADRVFCSRLCEIRHDVDAGLRHAMASLTIEVPPAWAIGVTTAACVLLAAGIGSLIGELLQLSVPAEVPVIEVAVPVSPAAPSGRIVTDEGSWRLELEGAPDTSVVVEVGGEPATIVRLDPSGRGQIVFTSFPPDAAEVRITALTGPTTLLGAIPAATATRPPAATATSAPTRTATATEPVTEPPAITPATTSTRTPTSTARVRTPDREPSATARPAPTRPSASPTATPAEEPDVGGPSPPVLHLVPDAGARLALTFDGAASSSGTTDLLDVLRQLDVRVTIFVTGEFIELHPGIVRRAALAGHEFGNHTFSHPHLTTYASNRRHDLLPGITRESIRDQLQRTEAAFRRATGRSMAPLWRAPFGEENRQLRSWALELGYLHVRWSSLQGASLDSLDWVEDEHSPLYVDPNRLVQRLLEFPRLEGGIVLMHLSTKRRVPPWSELPRFAEEVRARGLEIGTVTSLLEASDSWRPWYQRAAARHRELAEAEAAQ
jgi:peptidoglycan/xylan/chitin deacetylase (PgdA/CDA1 family)